MPRAPDGGLPPRDGQAAAPHPGGRGSELAAAGDHRVAEEHAGQDAARLHGEDH